MASSDRQYGIIENIEKHIDQLIMPSEKQPFDIIVNIENHIKRISSWIPSQAIIGIGKYSIQTILNGIVLDNTGDILPLFIDKSTKEIRNWSQSHLKPYNILGLDTKNDTLLWFHVYRDLIKNDSFIKRLKNKPLDYVSQAIVVASLEDGVGSSLFPLICSQLQMLNINPIALSILPSKVQPADAHFNAFSSMGLSISTGVTPIILIDRDNLENYVGVNRRGTTIKSNMIINYLIELLSEKTTLGQEISELSRSFNIKFFTPILTTGVSLRIYGSIENMLKTAILKPLLKFDLSSASVLYVFFRIPSHLKTKLAREKIDLSLANWFQDKVNLKSIYLTDPIYTQDTSDRIDIVILVGGINTTKLFTSMRKKINSIKKEALNLGFIDEKEWKEIAESLIKD